MNWQAESIMASKKRERAFNQKIDELECTLEDEEAAHRETLAMLDATKEKLAALQAWLNADDPRDYRLNVAKLGLRAAGEAWGIKPSAVSHLERGKPLAIQDGYNRLRDAIESGDVIHVKYCERNPDEETNDG